MAGTHGYGFGYILEIKRLDDETNIQGGVHHRRYRTERYRTYTQASETDIATSLLERDCKGLGNYSNGVIEIYEVDDGSHTDRKHNAVKMGRAD